MSAGADPFDGWAGLSLKTSLGTVLNPADVWSDRTIMALAKAIDLTLLLDSNWPTSSRDVSNDDQTHSSEEDEFLLWEEAEAAMRLDLEARPRARTES